MRRHDYLSRPYNVRVVGHKGLQRTKSFVLIAGIGEQRSLVLIFTKTQSMEEGTGSEQDQVIPLAPLDTLAWAHRLGFCVLTVVIPLRQFGFRHLFRCYSKITFK